MSRCRPRKASLPGFVLRDVHGTAGILYVLAPGCGRGTRSNGKNTTCRKNVVSRRVCGGRKAAGFVPIMHGKSFRASAPSFVDKEGNFSYSASSGCGDRLPGVVGMVGRRPLVRVPPIRWQWVLFPGFVQGARLLPMSARPRDDHCLFRRMCTILKEVAMISRFRLCNEERSRVPRCYRVTNSSIRVMVPGMFHHLFCGPIKVSSSVE